MQYATVVNLKGERDTYRNAALLVDHTGTLRVVKHPIPRTGPVDILAAYPPTQYQVAHTRITDDHVDEPGETLYAGASGVEVAEAASRKV